MVEFPNNEFGITYIGTDSRPYSVFIKDGIYYYIILIYFFSMFFKLYSINKMYILG